jgi:hypothetical protein
MSAVRVTGSDELAGGAGSRTWQLRGAVASLTALLHRHWLFALALGVAAELRVMALLGFWPAMLIRLDSYDYLWGAVRLSPNLVNTSGYSLLLWLLRPLRSLAVVAAVQHVMGLAIALMMYVLLRRYLLPAWGATLAAAPVLFLPAELALEQHISPDMAAAFLMVAALTVLLIAERPPGWRRLAVSGLLAGSSAIVWPVTLPVLILIPGYLLIHRAGWRRAVGALLACAMPVLVYMAWFWAATGTLSLSDSSGLFLWSRTMSFANCAVIKPPPSLRGLCPTAQPDGLGSLAPAERPGPIYYLWDHQSWQWRQAAAHQFAPDTGAFTPAANAKAMRFGLMAIKAQPGAYLGLVAREMLQPFTSLDPAGTGTAASKLSFPALQPASATMSRADYQYAISAVRAYTGNAQGLTADLGSNIGTSVRTPYASILWSYQKIVLLPGPLFALIVAAGLAGLLIPGRRSAAAALTGAAAVAMLALPVALHSYSYRFVISMLPLACIAAALAFRRTTIPRRQG